MLQHEYADVNGVRLHYVRAGAGKLILFAHGFPEFWYQWRRQCIEFERDHLVLAPDLRGYNLSSKPASLEQYSVPVLVEDLLALARYHGQEKFILVGHDWGGVVAWAFALLHPEALEKLVILNAPHPAIFERELRENPAQQRASQYALMFRNAMAERVLSAGHYALLVQTVLSDGLKQGYLDADDQHAYLEAWSQPGALTGGLNYYRAVPMKAGGHGGEPHPDFTSYLPRLRVEIPTLVIWGEQDIYLLTGNLEGLESYVPRLTLKRVHDASHWIIHEKPELVNRYLREFLEER